MFSIIDLIAFSVLLGLALVSFIALFISQRKKAKLTESLVILELEKASLLDALGKLLAEKDTQSIEQTEGFLKFVSESRDWAFKYIEDVQAALEKFKDTVDSDIKYLSTYGKIVQHPLQESIDKITQAYFELQKFLPAEKDQV